MASSIAWLDASAAEQRRIRDIVAMFMQPGTVDELGIGQVRDALSDTLFPGCSVLHTRARYFLLVPWLFKEAERRNVRSVDVARWVDKRERALIEVLRGEGASEGLIGRLAGPRIKLTPAAMYWSGLQQFGIVGASLSPEAAAALRFGRDIDAEELADIQRGAWHPTMPASPDGFPEACPGALALTSDEAHWLSERIIHAVRGTALAELVSRSAPFDGKTEFLWHDTRLTDTDSAARDHVRHAELFSLVMLGPALLYNLLTASAFESNFGETDRFSSDQYRERLVDWADEVESMRHVLAAWDVADFWDTVYDRNPRIPWPTRAFVQEWFDIVRGGTTDLADRPALRTMIIERERRQKGRNARLSNVQPLKNWNGASGADRLLFRWTQVRRVVADIHEGLERSDAGA